MPDTGHVQFFCKHDEKLPKLKNEVRKFGH